MKPPFAKKPSAPDEETILDDEIDELLEDTDDETATASIADEGDVTENSATGLLERIAALEGQLAAAENARMRALADYQNLQRRSQSDRVTWSKLATQEMVAAILEPLEHLQRATAQLNDQGLTMVVKQLFEKLEEQGVKKVEAQDAPFDPATMEAIEGSNPEGKKVSTIVSNGYTLNGVLLQPAKVKVG